MRNPPWSRDELIVALDFYMRHIPQIPAKTSSKIKELSELLNRMGEKISGERSETFRNPNGVYMKLMNFRRFDPDYGGSGLERGGKDEEIVWNLFADEPDNLRSTALSIADFAAQNDDQTVAQVLESDAFDIDAQEGRILTREHKYRERNARIVERKKQQFFTENGRLFCEVCEFDFFEQYGAIGEGFIECHHTKPVSELRPGERTKLSDLVLLCSNCHRMIHRRRPWLQTEELRVLTLDARTR